MIKRKLIIGDLTVGGEPPPAPPKTPTPQHTRPDDPEWQRFGQHGYRCPDCMFVSFSALEFAHHRLNAPHVFAHTQGSSGLSAYSFIPPAGAVVAEEIHPSQFPAPHQWIENEPVAITGPSSEEETVDIRNQHGLITAICPICSTGLASAVELSSHLRWFHGRGQLLTSATALIPEPTAYAPAHSMSWVCEHANESPATCPCPDDCSCRIGGSCRAQLCPAETNTNAGRIHCRLSIGHLISHRGRHANGSDCYWAADTQTVEQSRPTSAGFWQRARRLFHW